jgi:pullulanase
MDESIKFGIVAACKHPQIDYSKVNYSKAPYASQPYNTVTYCECHDNNVLWDKLTISATDATEEERKQMHKLALSIVLTSQGISFLHAGTEFLRTKKGVENSYNSSDSINEIDWSLKTKNKDVFEYVKGLIKIRKEHPAFRLKTTEQIASLIRFDEKTSEGVIIYEIDGNGVADKWGKIRVMFNGTNRIQHFQFDNANWKTAILNNKITDKENSQESNVLEPYSCSILFKN